MWSAIGYFWFIFYSGYCVQNNYNKRKTYANSWKTNYTTELITLERNPLTATGPATTRLTPSV